MRGIHACARTPSRSLWCERGAVSGDMLIFAPTRDAAVIAKPGGAEQAAAAGRVPEPAVRVLARPAGHPKCDCMRV